MSCFHPHLGVKYGKKTRRDKMKRFCPVLLIPLVVILLLVSCKKEADHISVQHILIAFKGSIPKDTVTRTMEEAEKLANEIFERARKGEDFDALVKEYTDDRYPGVYKMANFDIEPNRDQGEAERGQMVTGFGDVSFSLSVNEIGMAEFSPEGSKYGWHIIKRIK
jgi:foldase protein PrsA